MNSYLRPASLSAALQARRRDPDALLLAGGTDLMAQGAGGMRPGASVIDLFGLPELVGIEFREGRLIIGAATTFAALADSAQVRAHAPALSAAAREVGAWQIQARATLGGNVGTSSPVGDSLPVLLALDAEVCVASESGERTVAYREFCTGYRATALAADEIIVAIEIPDRADWRQYWRKVGTRRAQSIAKVSLAAAAQLDGAGAVTDVRIALGAVRERPVRAEHAEAALVGQVPDAACADRVSAALDADIAPIDDIRSTAAYRRQVARNLVRSFVTGLR